MENNINCTDYISEVKLHVVTDWSFGRDSSINEDAIVYFLRFWMRAIAGNIEAIKPLENEIFGNTHKASLVSIKLANETNDADVRAAPQKGDIVLLTFVYKTITAKKKYDSLLKSILKAGSLLGGVGGGAKKGRGSFTVDFSYQDEPSSGIKNIGFVICKAIKALRKVLADDSFVLPTLKLEDNQITFSDVKDSILIYPFLREVRLKPLAEENNQIVHLLNSRAKANVKERLIQDLDRSSTKSRAVKSICAKGSQAFSSTIRATYWNDNTAVFTLFQPSYITNQNHLENAKMASKLVFEEFCK